MQVLRTCKKCKLKFDILTEDYLKTQGSFVHQKCYIETQVKKGISHDTIMQAIDVIKETMEIEQRAKERAEREKAEKSLLAKRTQVNRKQDRSQFLSYISAKYGISTFPKYLFTKLATINNGTHPNVAQPIPYDDLLDMFKQSEKKLAQLRMRQKTFNKELKGIECFNYDLAVLINRYDGYLAWKQKQKTLEVEVVETVPNLISPTVNINKVAKQVVKKEDDDIMDILDEFY